MAKKRANGEGNIRKRKDDRWEGRYTAGYDAKTGRRIIRNVLGRTQAEVCLLYTSSHSFASPPGDVRRLPARAGTQQLRRPAPVSYTHLQGSLCTPLESDCSLLVTATVLTSVRHKPVSQNDNRIITFWSVTVRGCP